MQEIKKVPCNLSLAFRELYNILIACITRIKKGYKDVTKLERLSKLSRIYSLTTKNIVECSQANENSSLKAKRIISPVLRKPVTGMLANPKYSRGEREKWNFVHNLIAEIK